MKKALIFLSCYRVFVVLGEENLDVVESLRTSNAESVARLLAAIRAEVGASI